MDRTFMLMLPASFFEFAASFLELFAKLTEVSFTILFSLLAFSKIAEIVPDLLREESVGVDWGVGL